MSRVRFIARADDAGSSRSANAAIERAIGAGFIKNVSVMAPGPYAEEAAGLFAKSKKACFGMHATLNAEWDRVKWGPVSELPHASGLTDENGMFLPDPKLFSDTKPDMETIIAEYDAQLDRLARLGFDIRYVDSHMLPEIWVPGLDEAAEEWARRHSLIHHMYYYALPPGWREVARDPPRLIPALRAIPPGQYFFLVHPAVYSEEMLQTGNARLDGEQVAKVRAGEAKLAGSGWLRPALRVFGITTIRYDEAVPGKRMRADDLLSMFGGEEADETERL